MIAGPSSSGKTTTTRVLGSYLRSQGYDPICISTDDYFVERDETPKDEKGNYDYECLNAIDINLLNNNLINLLKQITGLDFMYLINALPQISLCLQRSIHGYCFK